LQPPLDQLLHRWMPAQRWYPAKGRGVGLRRLGGRRLEDAAGEVGIEVHVVGLDSGDRVDAVQVPLTVRGAPLEGADGALVGEAAHSELGRRWIYDAPHDPAYVEALLQALELAGGTARPNASAGSRVLTGEQSNTSIIVGAGTPDAVIVNVFRPLHPGAIPDVEVLAALTAAGGTRVPRLVGWLEGSWTGPDGGAASGHLAVAAEFLAGSQDAWREAVTAVEAGRDFTGEARALGAATAEVHTALAEAFGTSAVAEPSRAGLVAGLQERVAWAQRSTDALGRWHSQLAAHRAALERLENLPPLQRVHGDYHLGQVLHSPTRGWVLLDFEGEPLRPLAERVRPDLALRDVAGMLRSFDYAARHVTVGRADPAAEAAADAWAAAARGAFCAGYAAAGGTDPAGHAALLTALELDKALYEVVYETRNRPDWVDIPLHAVARLLT
jgi:1,4-alpha-glucan branching enzyme